MVATPDSRKRTRARFPLWLGLAALALAALGFGLWFGLGAGEPKPVAQAASHPVVSLTTTSTTVPVVSLPSPTLPPVSPAVSPARSALPAQPLPPDATSWLPASLPAGARAVRVPILMYHYIEAVPQLPAGLWAKRLTLSARRFKEEMDYLALNGYHPVTLAQIYSAMIGSAPLPAKSLALTFDDGGLDNYTTAFPVLQRHHFVATFFVITAAVGRPGYMSWAQLRALSRAGMAIESHTVHHRDLILLDDTRLRAELTGSREAIKSHLSIGADFLAYPDGDCDQRVMAAAQAAGYRVALADKYGAAGDLLYPQALYDWPREGVGPQETLTLFRKILSGTMGPPEIKGPAAKPSGAAHAPGGSGA